MRTKIWILVYIAMRPQRVTDMDLEDFDEFSSVDTDTDSVMDSEDFEGFQIPNRI